MRKWSHLELLLFAGGATAQIAYLGECSPSPLVWLFLPVVPLMIFLWLPIGSSPSRFRVNANLAAAVLYVALTAACVLLAACGVHPEGWYVFIGATLPGVALCMRAVPRLLRTRSELESYLASS